MANAILHKHLLQCRHHSIAPSTRQAYQSGWRAFLSFCSKFSISPLPASSLTLQYFCANISQHVSYKTIKVYLAGIHLTHIEHGLPNPTDDSPLQLVCRGIHHQQGNQQRTRLPITVSHLRTLKSHLRTLKEQLRVSHHTAHEQRMLWASFTLALYGFLRISEYLMLRCLDVTLTEEKITIWLRQSKTDPFRHGHCIQLYPTNSYTCPLRAFHNSIPNRLPSTLVFKAGRFLSLLREKLNAVLHQLLRRSGLNQSDYASHSFRIGAATTAAAAWIPTWLIMKLGRWTSNAYRSYIIHCPHQPFQKLFLALMLQINVHGTHTNNKLYDYMLHQHY